MHFIAIFYLQVRELNTNHTIEFSHRDVFGKLAIKNLFPTSEETSRTANPLEPPVSNQLHPETKKDMRAWTVHRLRHCAY